MKRAGTVRLRATLSKIAAALCLPKKVHWTKINGLAAYTWLKTV